jgi:uncharacterized protein (DUF2141 family)
MKHVFPIILLYLILYLFSCANQGSPSGGPRDTIPPTLISSLPTNKSLNYQERVFQFEFDERINADQLKTKLNITPLTENKFTVYIKKNILNIKFENPFEDSTTFTFNFADAVGDITEKNPVVNFTYAFSTGPIIDSIFVKGTVKDLYNNELQKEILIALYSIEDTLNLFTGKPRYFTKTDKEGNYQIENIKTGYYKIYAFEDKDNNLKNDPQKEKHGFKADSLNLFTSRDSINFVIQLIDASIPKFVRAKNTGQYFDVMYNKFISQYTLSKIDSNSQLNIPSNGLYKDNTIIRFYPDGSLSTEVDSLQIKINAIDSLGNTLQDTVYLQFKESRRKPEKFDITIAPNNNSSITKSVNIKIDFSKPITKINIDSIILSYDTLKYETIPDSIIIWNNRRTQLNFNTAVEISYIPNEIRLYNENQQKLDSIAKLSPDTVTTLLPSMSTKHPIPKNQIILAFKKAAFISIDQDSTEFTERKYPFLKPEDTGKIGGLIETKYQSYFFQLVDKSYNVIFQLKDPKEFIFPNVKPGSYSFRVLIDKNNDGKWSSGNILKNIEPEPIWFFYEEHSSLKAGWEIDFSTPAKMIKF